MTRGEVARLVVSLAAAAAAGAVLGWCWIFERDSRPHGHPFDRWFDGTVADR